MLLRASWLRIAAHVVAAFGCLYGAIELFRYRPGGGAVRYLEIAPLIVAFVLLNAELRRRLRALKAGSARGVVADDVWASRRRVEVGSVALWVSRATRSSG